MSGLNHLWDPLHKWVKISAGYQFQRCVWNLTNYLWSTVIIFKGVGCNAKFQEVIAKCFFCIVNPWNTSQLALIPLNFNQLTRCLFVNQCLSLKKTSTAFFQTWPLIILTYIIYRLLNTTYRLLTCSYISSGSHFFKNW